MAQRICPGHTQDMSARILIAVCSVLLFAPAVHASMLLEVLSIDETRATVLSFDQDTDADGIMEAASGWAGAINIRLGGVPMTAFCIDLFTHIYLNDAIQVDLTIPQAASARAAWLLYTKLPEVDTAVEGAALQFAMWQVMHNTSTTRVASSGATDAAVASLASAWVEESAGKGSTQATILTHVNGPAEKQQLITTEIVLPEPPSTGLLAIGLGAFVFAGRALRRRTLS
jgi:hypothetical protein